ncbi:MAG: NAD(P)H:quinone oxidoreductase [Pseudomonadota bacterium]
MSREILVLYYSRHGSTGALAEAVATGVESVQDCSARVRTVPEVAAKTAGRQPAVPAAGPPYAERGDLSDCAGIVLGSPTRFGNMAAALKHFIDGTSSEWLSGTLSGKPAGVFTASSSPHGGQESTLLSMVLPLIHHGMVWVGVPYRVAELTTTDGGGGPYGASHVSGADGVTTLTAAERSIARALGARVARAARVLAGGAIDRD